MQPLGRELESLLWARRYHEWILDEIRPYFGKFLVEVGAGTGNFSKLLLETAAPERLSLIEPQIALAEQLSLAVGEDERVTIFNSVFTQAAGQLDFMPDAVCYINVLEHIEKDLDELRAVYDALAPGGHLCIFVPAHAWLYGAIDEMAGHVRRYSKAGLEALVTEARFEIVKSIYFDIAGIFPWWLLYRVLRYRRFNVSQIKTYDRFVVPLMRACEQRVRPLIGKNVLLVARKC